MHWWLTERGKKTQIGMELMGLDVSTSLAVVIPLNHFAIIVQSVENVRKYNPDTGEPYAHPVKKYSLQVGNRNIPVKDANLVNGVREVISDPDITGQKPNYVLLAGPLGRTQFSSDYLELLGQDSNLKDDPRYWFVGKRLARSKSHRSDDAIVAASSVIEDVTATIKEVRDTLVSLGVYNYPTVAAIAHLSY